MAQTALPTLTRNLPRSNTSGCEARRAVSHALRSWHLAHLIDDAALVADEMVANAVGVSPIGGKVCLHLTYSPHGLVLRVWDQSNEAPRRIDIEVDEETLDLSPENFDENGGWGLVLVEALAAETWIEWTPPCGKWLCVLIKI